MEMSPFTLVTSVLDPRRITPLLELELDVEVPTPAVPSMVMVATPVDSMVSMPNT